MKTRTLALAAALAALVACTEDGPGSMIEAKPEAFDTETVYEIVPVGGRPSLPGEEGDLLQFDSEEAKRRFAKLVAPRAYLVPLSAEHTTQIWADKRTVHVFGATADGRLRPIHTHNPMTLREWRELMYGPDRPRREEVRR